MTSVPEPTEVIPTMKPIDAPIASGRELLDDELLVEPRDVPLR